MEPGADKYDHRCHDIDARVRVGPSSMQYDVLPMPQEADINPVPHKARHEKSRQAIRDVK